MEDRQPPGVDVTVIAGPTATGKSDVALQLARTRQAAILCLDSMQVYQGLDIGTGKPSEAERREIPHGGLDLADPGQTFSVADYLDHARDFLKKYSRVVIVGGTGLYYRALTRGVCGAPPGDPVLREELTGLTLAALRERLLQADPATHETIDRNNPRRLVRAIEVAETTGRPLAEWQRENQPPLLADFQSFYLHRERNDLRDRIAVRVRQMFDNGWEDEVRRLTTKYGLEIIGHCPAIGYAQIAQWQAAGGDREEVIRRITDATRQYAKRQQTWFKRERDYDVIEIDPGEDSASVTRRISSAL